MTPLLSSLDTYGPPFLTSLPLLIIRRATDWGEHGYIYLAFTNNTCGLADQALFVTIGNNLTQQYIVDDDYHFS